MKNLSYLLGIILLCIGCTEEKKGNFNIQGKITGLQKGTIYLEKVAIDSAYVIDSIFIDNGTESFSFSEQINEPNLFSIYIDSSLTKRIFFFGEPGDMTIDTDLNKFIANAKITGSKQQDFLKEHDDYIKEIQYRNLDLIKQRFDAKKNGELDKLEELDAKYNLNQKRMYLFTTNYAINHADHIIAAYIGVTRINKVNVKLKQKIYDALSQEVKESNYGIFLKEQIDRANL